MMEERKEQRCILLCHLSALFGYVVPFIGNVALPFVLWSKNKNESPLIDHHGKQAVNFQATVSIATILVTIFSISVFEFGVAILPILSAANIVFIITATIKTSEGSRYQYPVSLRFLK